MPKGFDRVFDGGIAGQDDDGRTGVLFPDTGGDVVTAHVGQVHVNQRHGIGLLLEQAKSLCA